MTTTLLTRKVAHPLRWIGIFLVAVAAIAIFQFLQHRDYFWNAPRTSLEKVLWTSDPDYQTFYGPGTPQSTALARRLFDGHYLAQEFKVPDVPIYIYPPQTAVPYRADDPALIYNFKPEIAERLRATHGR